MVIFGCPKKKDNALLILKLLTHKSPQMTQRYAHLSNEVSREASEVMDYIGKDK